MLLLYLQVHILQYDPDQERLACARTLLHKPEVWDIATSCRERDLLITVWQQGEDPNSAASVHWLKALRGGHGL